MQAYQLEKVNDNEAGDENDELSEIGTDLESQEVPAKEFDLAGSFILEHDGPFSMIWTIFDISCCLASSYFYLWLATFGEDQKGAGCYPDMTKA